MKRIPYLVLTLAVLFGAGEATYAQLALDGGAGGRHFVVAFPDTTKNTFDARYPNNRYDDKVFLFIYSAVDNRISIRGNGYQRTWIPLVGGTFHIIDLTAADPRAPSPIAIEQCTPTRAGVFTILAGEPIIVIQYMVTKFGTEAWTPLPTELWGREYYAAAMPGEVGIDVSPGPDYDYTRKRKMFPAVITIVAAHDGTRVTIEPTGRVMIDTCRLVDVVLNAGEAYQVESYVDTSADPQIETRPDFGGTRILADKPIGVVSGNTRAMLIEPPVGHAKNSFRNAQIEALAPVEYYGREFVYLPTMDKRRPTTTTGDTLPGRRPGEFVRLYATTGNSPAIQRTDSSGTAGIDLDPSRLTATDFRPLVTQPALYTSTTPVQAVMHTPAAVLRTLANGGNIGYYSWGGYSTTLVPREHWVTMAPFYAALHPAGMEHFVTVVTDTAHRNDVRLNDSPFVFNNGAIPNTDLVWGTLPVRAGIDHVLSGTNGARFHGYVYGTLTRGGYEEFRPYGVRPPAGDSSAGVLAGTPSTLYPAEYEEYLAIAYAYPLIADRRFPGPPDSLAMTLTQECATATLRISTVSGTSGLRSIALENAINTKILSRSPDPLIGVAEATVQVTAINRSESASATIVISDRTGWTWKVPYRYTAEQLELNPTGGLNFGLLTPGSATSKTVRVTNPLDVPVTVEGVRLVNGNQRFTIVAPSTFPVVVPPNPGSFLIEVEARPDAPDRSYVDTLQIAMACDSIRVPVIAETTDPCVNIGDLDFGTLRPGESKTLPLRICNDGGGEVRFNNPSNGPVIEWLVRSFSVSPADIDRIKSTVLRRGDCVMINVTFTATVAGSFSDVVRFWASVRKCRDTSVWTARVTGPVAAPGELAIAPLQLHPARPNPFTGSTELSFDVTRHDHVRLSVTDALGREVAVPWDAPADAGRHRVTFAAEGLPAGVYTVTLTSGHARLSRAVLLLR